MFRSLQNQIIIQSFKPRASLTGPLMATIKLQWQPKSLLEMHRDVAWLHFPKKIWRHHTTLNFPGRFWGHSRANVHCLLDLWVSPETTAYKVSVSWHDPKQENHHLRAFQGKLFLPIPLSLIQTTRQAGGREGEEKQHDKLGVEMWSGKHTWHKCG